MADSNLEEAKEASKRLISKFFGGAEGCTSDFIRAHRRFLELHRRALNRRAYKQADLKYERYISNQLEDAEKNINRAEELMMDMDDFENPIRQELIKELCSHAFTLITLGAAAHPAMVGVGLIRRQREANAAKQASEDHTITQMLKDLAKREDYKPSELWMDFYGDLDVMGLDPEESEDRIDYAGGSIRYDAFRKRIIRYRK